MHVKIAPVIVLIALAACQVPNVSVTEPASKATDVSASATQAQAPDKAAQPEPGKKADEKAAALAKKQKALRDKQRKLAHARVEHQVAALDRRVKAMTTVAALDKAARKLEVANQALQLFLVDQKPRELEKKRILVDRSMHRADHSKDELAELTAMYDADEFAKATKELVLKRGRRSLEMAERDLAVAKKELTEFENHALPLKERELRDSVSDAELARKKAEAEAEKVAIQKDLALLKEREAISDLQEEIGELEKELEGKS